MSPVSVSGKTDPYPKLPIEQKTLDRLVYDAKGWAMAHGLGMRTKQYRDKSDVAQLLPFALLPSKVPAQLYNEAVDVGPLIARLSFLVSLDYEFVKEALKETIKSDTFTRRLFDIYTNIMREGMAQSVFALIQRTDYMGHRCNDRGCSALKMIEINTIGVGAPGFGGLVTGCQIETMRKLGVSEPDISSRVPLNDSMHTVTASLTAAWRAYGKVNAIVLIVNEQDDPCSVEDWLIMEAMKTVNNSLIEVTKIALTVDYDRLELDETSRQLTLDGHREVAVVYFCGYVDPKDYESEIEWQCRIRIERSRAVKVPFIGVQLADTKKIQQVLEQPGILERFFPDEPETVARIRSTFMRQWSLDEHDPNTRQAIAMAKNDPSKYVLKSQREGGLGGIYFDEDIVKKLDEFTPKQLNAHILMERMKPDSFQNYLLKPLQPVVLQKCSTEIGIFAYLVGDGKTKTVLQSQVSGHTLKTKPYEFNQAGIAGGYGVCDSVFLD